MHCVFYHLRHGRQKKKNDPRVSNQSFGNLLAHFEVQRARIFFCGIRRKTAGFYHVLSVCEEPSVSVESAMESNDVLMTCFCTVSLSGTMRSLEIAVQDCRFWAATQAFSLRNPSIMSRHRQAHHTQTSPRTTRSPNVARRHVAVRAQPLQPPLRCRLRQTQRGRVFLVAEASVRHV